MFGYFFEAKNPDHVLSKNNILDIYRNLISLLFPIPCMMHTPINY